LQYNAQLSHGQKRRIFLDIGSNIGWFTYLWAAHGIDVIAVEAMEYNINAQRKTLYTNPPIARHVRLYNRLLGSSGQGRRCINFHETVGLPNRGNGQIVSDNGKQLECHPVAQFAELNAFDRAREQIYAMKIDVEGFEVHVMEGLGLGVADLPCYIWIEIVGRKAGTHNFDVVQRGKAGTIRDWLKQQGYKRDLTYTGGGDHDFVFTRGGELCATSQTKVKVPLTTDPEPQCWLLKNLHTPSKCTDR